MYLGNERKPITRLKEVKKGPRLSPSLWANWKKLVSSCILILRLCLAQMNVEIVY